MNISFSELKLNSKKRIISKGSRIILVSCLFFVLLYILSYLNTRLSGYDIFLNDYYEAAVEYSESGDESVFSDLTYPTITPLALLLLAAIICMQELTNIGYTGYCLTQSRSINAGFRDIFNSFDHLLRILTISILRLLITAAYILPAVAAIVLAGENTFVMALSLLYMAFIIIRISLQYGLVFFVMFDNPEMTALKCMKQSKQLVNGRLMQYFKLNLSFLSWQILNSILSSFYMPFLAIWLNPYRGLTMANYYNMLVGKYVVILFADENGQIK